MLPEDWGAVVWLPVEAGPAACGWESGPRTGVCARPKEASPKAAANKVVSRRSNSTVLNRLTLRDRIDLVQNSEGPRTAESKLEVSGCPHRPSFASQFFPLNFDAGYGQIFAP